MPAFYPVSIYKWCTMTLSTQPYQTEWNIPVRRIKIREYQFSWNTLYDTDGRLHSVHKIYEQNNDRIQGIFHTKFWQKLTKRLGVERCMIVDEVLLDFLEKVHHLYLQTYTLTNLCSVQAKWSICLATFMILWVITLTDILISHSCILSKDTSTSLQDVRFSQQWR